MISRQRFTFHTPWARYRVKKYFKTKAQHTFDQSSFSFLPAPPLPPPSPLLTSAEWVACPTASSLSPVRMRLFNYYFTKCMLTVTLVVPRRLSFCLVDRRADDRVPAFYPPFTSHATAHFRHYNCNGFFGWAHSISALLYRAISTSQDPSNGIDQGFETISKPSTWSTDELTAAFSHITHHFPPCKCVFTLFSAPSAPSMSQETLSLLFFLLFVAEKLFDRYRATKFPKPKHRIPKAFGVGDRRAHRLFSGNASPSPSNANSYLRNFYRNRPSQWGRRRVHRREDFLSRAGKRKQRRSLRPGNSGHSLRLNEWPRKLFISGFLRPPTLSIGQETNRSTVDFSFRGGKRRQ